MTRFGSSSLTSSLSARRKAKANVNTNNNTNYNTKGNTKAKDKAKEIAVDIQRFRERKKKKKNIDLEKLEEWGGSYEDIIVDVVAEEMRNPFTTEDELNPVIVFQDGWRIVLTTVGMHDVLEAHYGYETDAWVDSHIRLFRRPNPRKPGDDEKAVECLDQSCRLCRPHLSESDVSADAPTPPVPPSDATATVQPSTPGATRKPVKARLWSEGATQLKNAWNRIVTPPLPQVQRLSPQRIRTCEIAIKEYGLDALTSACQAVEKSAFCRGSGNRGWVAMFDWLIRADHCLKVLEGAYDAQPETPKAQPRSTNSLSDQNRREMEAFVTRGQVSPLALKEETR